MPTISLGLIVPVGAGFERPYHWRSDEGVLYASIRFDAGGYSNGHIQGEPAGLRELAAALVEATDQADSAPAEPEAVAS